MQSSGLTNFVIGSIGAMAPEILRLYNLRTKPQFRWSWGYLLFSIPFILLGGFMAWILEPTTKYAAFYSGLSTPTLLTTALKSSVESQRDLTDFYSGSVKIEETKTEGLDLGGESQKSVDIQPGESKIRLGESLKSTGIQQSVENEPIEKSRVEKRPKPRVRTHVKPRVRTDVRLKGIVKQNFISRMIKQFLNGL